MVGKTETDEVARARTDVVVEVKTGEFVAEINLTSMESGEEIKYEAKKLKNNSETQFSSEVVCVRNDSHKYEVQNFKHNLPSHEVLIRTFINIVDYKSTLDCG